jgi:hypothetical protein
VTITFLAAAIWGVAAPQAGAYRIVGKPWPGKTVSYYSTGGPRANALVDRAARVWNRAGVGIHLKRSPASGAQVVVSGTPGRCRGRATMGYPGAQMSWLYIGPCPSGLMVLVLAHEFGHVLGLGHEPRRCALMNPGVNAFNGTPSRCPRHSLAYWLKRPLLPDDSRGARALAARSISVADSAPRAREAQQFVEPTYDFVAGLFEPALARTARPGPSTPHGEDRARGDGHGCAARRLPPEVAEARGSRCRLTGTSRGHTPWIRSTGPRTGWTSTPPG